MSNYTRLRDMPEQLAEQVRAEVIHQRKMFPTYTYQGITEAVNRLPNVTLPSETIRDILRNAKERGEIDNISSTRGLFVGDDQPSGPPPLEEDADPMDALRETLENYSPLAQVPARIQAVRIEDMEFDTPEVAVPLFSDLHYGQKVDRRVSGGIGEYNIDIARERLTRWRDGVLRFVQMRQVFMPINELHAFALGDDIEGHGNMFGSQALEMTGSIEEQVSTFVVDMTQVILDLTARFKHSTWYKVYGNHGRVTARAKDSYGPDNVELWAWDQIAERVGRELGGHWIKHENGSEVSPAGIKSMVGGEVDFHIARPFFIMAEILGWTFYARHGHRIGGLTRTYTGAQQNKLAMNSIIGEVINYMVKAHLHEAQSIEGEINGEVIQNGCFVGPSQFMLEANRPAANLPSQELLFVHPTRGKTQQNRIHLATVDEVRTLEVIGRDPEKVRQVIGKQ